MKTLVRILFVAACFVGLAHGQQTYNSTGVGANRNDPPHATFIFGNPPGETQLIVECEPAYHRAQLITNSGAPGQQASNFFDVTCSGPVNTYPGGLLHITFTVTGLPQTVYLTPQNFDLTLNSATWTLFQDPNKGYRWQTVGSAQIVY